MSVFKCNAWKHTGQTHGQITFTNPTAFRINENGEAPKYIRPVQRLVARSFLSSGFCKEAGMCFMTCKHNGLMLLAETL